MADVTPIRVVVDGSGDTTGLSEFLSGETLGLVHGGTGATTAAGAISSLGLHAIAVSGSYADLLNKPTTDGITEGTTNLYYTDARVTSYLNTNSYVTQSYVDNAVSNILDGAPGVLDTLNELAAAIGDDANFITTINSSISTVQSNVDALFGSKSTSDLSEGTNLYYTNTRADDRIALQVGTNLDLSNKSTTNLSEGTNLYFTDERVDDRVANLITDGVGITKSYDDVGNLLNIAIDFSEFDSDDIVEGAVNTFLNNKSTDDLSEGSTNLYFTNERVDDRVDSLIVGGTNISTTYSDLNNRLTFNIDSTGGLPLSNNSTSDLPEGTNLYYTNARADARVSAGISSNGIALESWVLSVTDPISANLSSEITRATNAESTEISRATAKENSIQSDLDDEIFDRETAISNLTTTDIAEGTNLYYTDTRARGAISVTGDLTYDSATGIISTQGLASSTTDDLSEGTTNLYYTDSRARASIDGQIVKFANMFAAEANLPSATTYHGMFAHVHATGRGYFAHAGNWIKLLDESSSTTTDITEGTNLYYTDSRARAAIDGQIVKFANMFATEGNLPSATTYHGMFAHVHATGKGYFAHAGNWIKLLDESSSTTTDLTEGTNLYYTESRTDARIALQVGASLDLSNKTTSDLSEGTNLYYTQARFDTAFTAKSTTNLSEGTNLYYTQARFDTAFTAKSTTNLSEGTNLYFTNERVDDRVSNLIQAGSNVTVSYDDVNNTLTISATEDNLSNNTTSDLAEGTNLYYTAARDTAQFNTDLATKSTTNLSEGTNLYFTNARVQTKLGDVSGDIIPDTDVTYDLGSSTHKFRDLYLSGSSIILGTIELKDNGGVFETTPVGGGTTLTYATQTYVTTQIANLVDTAPTTLDTLNELAAALGDDANFSTTITNSIATKLSTSDFTTTANTWVGTKSTSDLSEGTNLYYTESRTDARIAAQVGTSLDLSNKSTTDLTEGTNLYFTDARALAATDGQIVKFANMFAAEGNLPSATTYHGMFAHVHGTGKGYFAHAGSWIKLLDESSSTTTDLTEGTNLYYTDARVDARITNAGIVNNIGDLGDVNLTTPATNGQSLVWDNANSEFIAGDSFSQSDFNTAFTAKSTTNLSEGTNLYYTDARADARVTANTVTIISDLDDEIFDRETADADLQTQINTLTSSTGASIVVSATPPTSPSAGDLWFDSSTLETFIYYNDGTTSQWVEASSGQASAYSGFDTDFAGKSTTDLSEGTNLYYTDARVRSHITGTDLDMGSNNITTTGKMLYANMYATEGDLPSATTYHGMFAHVHGTGKGYFAHAGGWKKLLDESSSTTTNLTEGTNLYYTESRTDARVALQVGTALDLSNKSTSDLSEGTNLYYTDARVQTKLGDVSGNIIPDTDVTYDLGSSTHKFKDLYLSGSTIHLGSIELSDNGGDLEVTPIAGGSTSTFATTTYVTTAIANLVDTAPSTLDTLNELAAALGDDANFATTVTTSLGTKLNLSGGTMTGALDMGSNNVTTTGKVLFANMYATEANLPSATTYHGMFAHVHATGKGYFAHAGSWIKLLDESSSTTTDITEGTNLYYTDARVRTHITGADLDMGSNDITTTGKMLYANMYAAEANLPSATTYHGMFAHVHGTGKGYFAHAGSWIKLLDESSSTTTNLSEGTNLYYTDARVRSHITGADLDMGSNDITTTGKMLFANMYATTGDLPSATTYHGMFAHVHGTGKGYFAHAGSWVELANNSQIVAQDFSWASITGTPTTIAGYGITDAFDGTYASLTGAPTIPTSINNLTDVDIYTTAPTNGQTLVWDNANNKFIPGAASGGSYNDAAVDTHLNQSNPTSGYVLSWDGSDYAWVAQSGGGGGAATLQVSDAAPSSPTANDLWLNSTNMKLFVYYADGSSNQWVEVGAGGTISGGGGGSSVSVADTAPTSPSDGDMWFNSTDTKLYIYYNDGSSSQWVQALPSGGSGSGGSSSSNTWAEKTAAHTVVAGEKLLVDCSSAAVTVTLPAAATLGDEIRIIDATGNSSTNNITIARNGHKIQGAADDLTINTDRAAFGLVYYNVSQGWLLTER